MEEKRNVNISFKTTSSNKMNWTNLAEEKNISLSELMHCAVEHYYDDSVSIPSELKEQIKALSKELSKTKNELSNLKLEFQVKEERLDTVISGLKSENKELSNDYQKALNRINKLETDKQKMHTKIDSFAEKHSALQIGLFSAINSDEIRDLKS